MLNRTTTVVHNISPSLLTLSLSPSPQVNNTYNPIAAPPEPLSTYQQGHEG